MSNAAPPSPPTAPQSSLAARFVRLVALLVLCGLFVSIVAIVGGIAVLIAPGPATAQKTIIIPPRSGSMQIGKILADNDIVYDMWQFTLPARLLAHGKLRPGEYEFPPQMTVLDILALLQSGKTVIRKLSVPEGLTVVEVIKLLQDEPALTGAIDIRPLEGSLLPETYFFSYGDARAAILARMQEDASEALQKLWETRAPDLPITTPAEARILASIVEKETAVPQERKRIAGVFINRLRRGMRLQSDPTTIYALTNGQLPLGRSLTLADLAVPSPYNTYVAAGLPPAPIANPGRASLEAVLNPEKNDFLFFVADGSGGHAFAKTLEEHNANVARWRKLNEK